ncbi:MAG: DUF2851 family protein [Dehalococcoidia bacterium]|nr:DUF2851 family protein [Dehalococcoidia bacterium]
MASRTIAARALPGTAPRHPVGRHPSAGSGQALKVPPYGNLADSARAARSASSPRRGAASGGPAAACQPPALCERDLARLWEGQRFPPEALRTRGGERLRVIYRGRAGSGPGPDFRDAVIATPQGLLHGDVELHVRTSDFRRHGHGRDPGYDGVALHLVFWHDEAEDTLLASGRRVPVVGLADWLAERTREIQGWLSRPAQWQEPCRSAVERLGADAVGAALDALGERRFQQLRDGWRVRLRRSGDGEELLWAGLLEGLGYGGQRELWRLLGGRLAWAQLRPEIMAQERRERLGAARRLLCTAAAGLPCRVRSAGVRPGNRVELRLEAAAHLAVRFAPGGLASALLAPLAGPPAGAQRELARALTVHGLIGPARALELLANAVLPLAAELGGAAAEATARAIYARLPLPARYGSLRHLHRAAAAVPVNMRRQQGMLYLLKHYCTQGGCGKCPLS